MSHEPHIVTFGCRLNFYESEVIRKHAQAAGLKDVVIFNTCTVTAEATRQARQKIRRTRREQPDAHIIVTGCAAQVDPASFTQMAEVDRVIGNHEKLNARAYGKLTDPKTARVQVNDIFSVNETAGHMIDGFGERTRAFVQIQNGCDHRCTFCIIPYGRGNSRSVAIGDAIDQIKRLVDKGFHEVVLTGVDITSFGGDLPGAPTLGTLVQKILTLVPDLPRLRISSIDSIEVDAPLMDAITSEPRLMPHLHLSLQAGDNMILKRMKRRHNREQAIAFCNAVRAKRPEVVFGADIIAGFPTETEAMFAKSLDLITASGLTWLHVFPYSARVGTPAARMPQIEKAVRRERAARLREAGERQVARLFAQNIGTRDRLLVERRDGDGRIHGHGETFIPIILDPEPTTASMNAGDLVDVTLAHRDAVTMRGIIERPAP